MTELLSLAHDAKWRDAFTRAGGEAALARMGDRFEYDATWAWSVGQFVVVLNGVSSSDITIGHDGDNISFRNPFAAALVCRAVLVEQGA